MINSLTAFGAMLRERDLFVHDGRHLRRLHISLRTQLLLLAVAAMVLGWSVFATVRMVNGVGGPTAMTRDIAGLTAATEARARQIERRQELLAAMIAGKSVDLAALAQADALVALPASLAGPLARAEDANRQQAALVARALDTRYQVTAGELARLGLTAARVAKGASQPATGGPFEAAAASTAGDATFKALFTSWKKLDNLQSGAIAVPSDKPVRTAAFTSGYGVRSDPFQGRAAMHAGIDLAGPVGTPIYATADGTVLRASWNNGGYGNLVEIDHGKGIDTRYGHLSAILVSVGQHIVRGQQIARMGSTGRSTGSHLHYEVRIDGRAVNPIPFMKSTDYLLAMQHHSGGGSMDAVALGGPKR